MLKSKRGQLQALTGIGWSLVSFGIIVGLGMIVLTKFGDQVAICTADKTWDATLQLCTNATGSAEGAGTAFTNIGYVTTQLGSTGLAGWIPLIVVVVIAGFIFLYLGMGGKGKNY